MLPHRYILEPYNGKGSRYSCPRCQRRHTLSRYIDTETGSQLHPVAGRCSREAKCGYHYPPRQYFHDNHIDMPAMPAPVAPRPVAVSAPAKAPSLIPPHVFKASLQYKGGNHFMRYLLSLFGRELARQVAGRYFIGSARHWHGATVFWQIDTQGNIRAGKVMLYHASTGKRVKKPYNHITWAHSLLAIKDFELRQCLFGEHLLNNKHGPVALVESEKTAIIASVYWPQFIWLAVGSLSNLNAEKCSVLAGRSVVLFPDLNGYEKWRSKAMELHKLAGLRICSMLEEIATPQEKEQGLDLADYLTRFSYKEFASRQPVPLLQPVLQSYSPMPDETVWLSDKPVADNWDDAIHTLEQYFSSTVLPDAPFKPNHYSTILNAEKYIEGHMGTVKANKGKKTFLPYLERLWGLKSYLEGHYTTGA